MSAKFWKLKEATSGTVFISASSAGEKSRRSGNRSIDLAPGAIIGGAYKIIELIGCGGMGEVYLARHESLGKKCALKVIPPEQVTEMGWRRFQLEAKAVAKLEHINLLRVTDLGIHEGCLPFYAMDYVEGKNLADLLAEFGPMPLSTALEIFVQVCDGVDCAHRNGLLHRDLKPANIMVQKTKVGQSVAKVLDFGLAKLITQDRFKQSLTAVGDVFGSPFYMSPEQCNGDKLDRRSDIYSLGCTIFECLTGRPPFIGNIVAGVIFSQLEADPPSLESIAGKGRFPASMEIVMAKLLRKNPVERYQTLLELRGDLERVARGEDVQPFYVSRGRYVPAASGLGASETGLVEIKSANKRITLDRRSFVAVVTTVALLMTLLSAWLWQKNSAVKLAHLPQQKTVSLTPNQSLSETPRAQLKDSEPAVEQTVPKALVPEAPPASSKDTKPYSKRVTQNGKKWLVFDFPKDTSIGDLWVGRPLGALWADGPRGDRLEAKGVQKVPFGVRVLFAPSPMALKYPNYFKRFRPMDLFGICLENSEALKNKMTPDIQNLGELGYSEGKTIIQQPENSQALDNRDEKTMTRNLETLLCVPGVQALELSGFANLSGANLKRLDGFSSLRQLDLKGEHIDTEVFSKLSNLGRLESLSLHVHELLFPVESGVELETSKQARLAPILDSLRNSRQLTTLILASVISVDQAALIANFPNLKRLVLWGVEPGSSTGRALYRLSKAPQLEELQIHQLQIGLGAVPMFKSFKSLRKLYVEPSGASDREQSVLSNAFRERPEVIWIGNGVPGISFP